MGIPMVSMADIAFLLIIFFTLTSSFAREQGLKVDLATAKHLEELPEIDINIDISDQGTVAINGKAMTVDQVEPELSALFMTTKTRLVTIRADKDAPYGVVFGVLSVVRKLGGKISLAGERVEPEQLE